MKYRPEKYRTNNTGTTQRLTTRGWENTGFMRKTLDKFIDKTVAKLSAGKTTK